VQRLRGNPVMGKTVSVSSHEAGSKRRTGRRALAAVAVVGAVALVAACGSSSSSKGGAAKAPGAVKGKASTGGVSGLYGSLPATGTPTTGGTISLAQLTGSTPAYIMPIVPAASASVYTVNDFINNLYLPLYSGPEGATPKFNPALDLANSPSYSADNKTVTFSLKSGFKWSNGAPVDANDVVFYIDEVKAAVKENAANYSAYTPGLFPDNVASATTSGADTVVLKLTKAYNPGYFSNDQLNQLYAMPSTDWNVASSGGAHLDYTKAANAKKIYDYLAKAGAAVGTFGTNPLWKDVDGPFALTSFNATNSDFSMVPNPSYGGTIKAKFSKLNVVTYTSITAQINALKSNAVDISQVDFSQLGQVNSLRSQGYSVFGYPGWGWYGAFFNFKDKTGDFDKIISQLYVRQALAHLTDQAGYIKGVFKNAAGLAYGPVPSVPISPYTPSDAVTTPYPFSISAAKQLMTSHGWKIVNGSLTCETPGTGANQCGSGIPKGTPFSFTWFYLEASQSPSVGLESEAFASDAKQIGINIKLTAKTFNFLITNYDDANPADAKYTNQWAVNDFGGFTNDNYPTQNSIFNTTGTYNEGGFSSPQVDSAINASVFGGNPSAVKSEASILTQQVPVLFNPNSDLIYAVKNTVGGQSDGFLSLTQNYQFPQYWYVTK
jgi:peptide/nickel transport system substrate-binding protein